MTTTTNILLAIGRRPGVRPQTSPALPHLQLAQWPSQHIVQALVQGCRSWPGVRLRESRMAIAGAVALWLEDGHGNGPAGAFIDDHEFCHICETPAGFIHLTLPDPIRETLIEYGWAEPHPAARAGMISPTIVMVYAPRDAEELQGVLRIVHLSYLFATGEHAR